MHVSSANSPSVPLSEFAIVNSRNMEGAADAPSRSSHSATAEELARLLAENANLRRRLREATASGHGEFPPTRAGGDTGEFGRYALSRDAVERYSRSAMCPGVGAKGVAALLRATVLVVGAGGLGSPVAMYLAAGGLKHLIIADFDSVERSNLHRQIAHRDADVGMNKAESAAAACRRINPTVEVTAVTVPFQAGNALDLVRRVDVVVDASDNVATRYLVNEACVLTRRPLVSGSAMRWDGQVAVYRCDWERSGVGATPSPAQASLQKPAETGAGEVEGPSSRSFRVAAPSTPQPCYRCWFPVPPPPGASGSCSEDGVMGPVPGLVGCIQALEVQKLIVADGRWSGQPDDTEKHSIDALVGRLLIFDGRSGTMRTIKMRPWQASCVACGRSRGEDRPLEPLGEEYGAGYCPYVASATVRLAPEGKVLVPALRRRLSIGKRHRHATADSCGDATLSPPHSLVVLDVRDRSQVDLCRLRDSPCAADAVEVWCPLSDLQGSQGHPPPEQWGGAATRLPELLALPAVQRLQSAVIAVGAGLPDGEKVDVAVLCRRGRKSAVAVALLEAARGVAAASIERSSEEPLPPMLSADDRGRWLQRCRFLNVSGGLNAWSAECDSQFPVY